MGRKTKTHLGRPTERLLEDFVNGRKAELESGKLHFREVLPEARRACGNGEVSEYHLKKACHIMGIKLPRRKAMPAQERVVRAQRFHARNRILAKAVGIVAGQVRDMLAEFGGRSNDDFRRLCEASSVSSWIEHEVAKEVPMSGNGGNSLSDDAR